MCQCALAAQPLPHHDTQWSGCPLPVPEQSSSPASKVTNPHLQCQSHIHHRFCFPASPQTSSLSLTHSLTQKAVAMSAPDTRTLENPTIPTSWSVLQRSLSTRKLLLSLQVWPFFLSTGFRGTPCSPLPLSCLVSSFLSTSVTEDCKLAFPQPHSASKLIQKSMQAAWHRQPGLVLYAWTQLSVVDP